uniref:Uncharacterized protein n=1 Tax=Rhizophora mucronata TaxID=61149 RepID=A0A2P2P2D1_RHIMU
MQQSSNADANHHLEGNQNLSKPGITYLTLIHNMHISTRHKVIPSKQAFHTLERNDNSYRD